MGFYQLSVCQLTLVIHLNTLTVFLCKNISNLKSFIMLSIDSNVILFQSQK